MLWQQVQYVAGHGLSILVRGSVEQAFSGRVWGTSQALGVVGCSGRRWVVGSSQERNQPNSDHHQDLIDATAKECLSVPSDLRASVTACKDHRYRSARDISEYRSRFGVCLCVEVNVAAWGFSGIGGDSVKTETGLRVVPCSMIT